MTVIEFKDLLVELGRKINVPVYHYRAHKQTNKYMVWAEDSQSTSDWGNDTMVNQTLEGTIDYFTKTEFDENIIEIQNALNNGDISWRLNSVQYEDTTGYTHYEWVFEGVRYG